MGSEFGKPGTDTNVRIENKKLIKWVVNWSIQEDQSPRYQLAWTVLCFSLMQILFIEKWLHWLGKIISYLQGIKLLIVHAVETLGMK